MSLLPLINGQTLIIDDHKRGAKEIKEWDDKSVDIHIDKKTKFKIDGKKQDVRIRIPINSERQINISRGRNKNQNHVPNKLDQNKTNA